MQKCFMGLRPIRLCVVYVLLFFGLLLLVSCSAKSVRISVPKLGSSEDRQGLRAVVMLSKEKAIQRGVKVDNAEKGFAEFLRNDLQESQIFRSVEFMDHRFGEEPFGYEQIKNLRNRGIDILFVSRLVQCNFNSKTPGFLKSPLILPFIILQIPLLPVMPGSLHFDCEWQVHVYSTDDGKLLNTEKILWNDKRNYFYSFWYKRRKYAPRATAMLSNLQSVSNQMADKVANPLIQAYSRPVNNRIVDSSKVTDPRNLKLPSSNTVWRPAPGRKAWLLCIGVGTHKDSTVPSLPYARRDADYVRSWFTARGGAELPTENVKVLFDEQSTRVNVYSQIDWLRKKALPEDLIIVYFAGHGAPEISGDGSSVDAKYLILYDTDPQNLFATGLTLDDLRNKLDMVKADTQLLVLECCYAGGAGKMILERTPTADLQIRRKAIHNLGSHRGRIILSASSGRQMALGSEDVKGSLFTKSLIKNLGNGSYLLLKDCFPLVRNEVRRKANELGSTQEPEVYGDQNIDIMFK